MRCVRYVLIIFTSLLHSSSLLAKLHQPVEIIQSIPVTIYTEHYHAVKDVANYPNCVGIKDHPSSNQMLVEAILFCQALNMGPKKIKLKYVPVPTQLRALIEIEKGSVAASAFTLWGRNINPLTMWKSPDILVYGQYFKILYTAPQNKWLKHLNKEQLLTQATIALNPDWAVDSEALSCFKNIYNTTSKYSVMVGMVTSSRIDLMLHNVSHRDAMLFKFQAHTLTPVRGYKIVMPDTLNFVVSKTSRYGAGIESLLIAGIKKLKEQGAIKRAYKAVSFFDDRILDWQVINCAHHLQYN